MGTQPGKPIDPNIFQALIAKNPRLNATLEQGNALVQYILANGYNDVRLYCDTTASGENEAYLIPQHSNQDNSHLEGVDISGRTLDSLAVPEDLGIFLNVVVGSLPMVGGIENYFDVAGVQRMLKQGITLKGALE